MKEKMENLKNSLLKKFESIPRFKRLKKEYVNVKNVNNDLKIIGITGSFGKSTTAFIVHEYLKSIGCKSILYSSIKIDSPTSIIKGDESCELPVRNEKTLLSIIEEAESYNAEYLVLEINESTIDVVKDVPFDVRVLTDFNPNHNFEHYTEDEYKKLKKSFFENVEECICVMGIGTSMSKENYEEFMKVNSYPKITFGSKYLCEKRGVDTKTINFLLHEFEDNLTGLEMEVLENGKNTHFKTSVIFAYNILNFLCAMATLEALQVFNSKLFNKCIKNMEIPGREEILKVNNRTIIIGLSLYPILRYLNAYKNNQEITKIKVVTGSLGSGFYTWDKKYKSDEFIKGRSYVRKKAMEEVNGYADYVYLTENDNAKENVLDICLELQNYLTNVSSEIVVDRKQAIKYAIENSQNGDLIFIAGRGNRRILCDSETTVKLFKDKDVVKECLKELGW